MLKRLVVLLGFLFLLTPQLCSEEQDTETLSERSEKGERLSEQELEEMLKELRGEAVSVDISARIRGEDGESVWNTTSRRLTLSGRSVDVTMKGDNIKVVAHIIPFVKEDNSILLVARGKVWIDTKEQEKTRYYSTMKSLPVDPGESVLFFPVGVAVDAEKNVYTIEMEIRVNTYEEH